MVMPTMSSVFRLRRMLLTFLGGVCLSCAVIVVAVYAGQRHLIFPAPSGVIPEDPGDGVEHIPLEKGHAFLALPFEPSGRAPLMVFTHGNAELALWSIDEFRIYRQMGMAVLHVEYPGYGGAPGSPSSASIGDSVIQAVDRALQRSDIDSDRVVAYGRSVGTGPSCDLATRRPVAALVLEAPFESLKKMAGEMGFPAFLLKDRFDNAAAVASLDIPMLLYHGRRDSIIPHGHSERLQKLATNAELISADCGHNDCPRPWGHVLSFLEAEGIL